MIQIRKDIPHPGLVSSFDVRGSAETNLFEEELPYYWHGTEAWTRGICRNAVSFEHYLVTLEIPLINRQGLFCCKRDVEGKE